MKQPDLLGAQPCLKEMPPDVGSRCPIMRITRWVFAMLASLAPPPARALGDRASGSVFRKTLAPAARRAPRRGHQCPFLRLMLVLGVQSVAGFATRPAPCMQQPVKAAAKVAPRAAPAALAGAPRDGPVLVLGGGWLGSRLARHLHHSGRDVSVTCRDPKAWGDKAPYFQPVDLGAVSPRTAFVLEDRRTWANLPDPSTLSAVVVTFPMVDLDAAVAFHGAYLSRAPSAVLCGSTSVYKVAEPNAHVTEESPLSGDSARGLVEEALRARGATLLAIGGIFGGGTSNQDLSSRSVCSCLAMHTAHAPSTSRHKLVNMAHVDDIIAAACALVDGPRPGERFNVVSCTHTVGELLGRCGMPEPATVVDDPPDASSKRIDNSKLVALLGDRSLRTVDDETEGTRVDAAAAGIRKPASAFAAS